MSSTPSPFIAHEAFLLARHNKADERRCHALHELLETGLALSQALRTELARASLTETGFRLLACLVRNPADSATSASLADALHLSSQTLNQLLSRLELSGLISRAPAAGGRRALVISLTARGSATFQSAARRLLAATGRLMDSLAPGDLDALHRSCASLRAAIPHHVSPIS